MHYALIVAPLGLEPRHTEPESAVLPLHNRAVKGCLIRKATFWFYMVDYPSMLRRIPAATAEPITPATLGPIACINK